MFNNVAFSYFRFFPSELHKYIFGEKHIIVNDSKIKLPYGYYLADITDNYFDGPKYTARDCSFSSITIDEYRPMHGCDNEFFELYFLEVYQRNYSKINDATINIFSLCKFNESKFVICRTATYFYHYLYLYSYDAYIPEKCIEISVLSYKEDYDDFLRIIRTIVFDNEPGEFEFLMQ
jgi:hypothetical protein